MKWNGPDSIKSWLISLCCCFINSMMFGFARLSGVLFVASISRYNIGRQQASLPYTLASAIRNLSGPFVGFMDYKFGVRATTSFGALIGALGVGLCYFAESIVPVTILWGIIFGLGFGLGNILLPIPLNQYFEKHRATASGISFSGGCIGSFILPPVVEIMLNNYGLSQTFLLLSAFILNCVPAALLLRKPNFEIQSKKHQVRNQEEKHEIISKIQPPLYTIENHAIKNEMLEKRNSVKNIIDLNDIKSSQMYSALTYEEKLKRLSTQTLLSGYSVRMSTSEPLDVEEIMKNSKGKREIDLNILGGETFSLSSENTERDGVSEKDDVFENDTKSASVHSEEDVLSLKLASALSNNPILCSNKRNNLCDFYENLNYQPDADEIFVNSSSSNNSHITGKPKDSMSHCMTNQNSNSTSLQGEYYDQGEYMISSPDEKQNFSLKPVNHANENEGPYNKNQNAVDKNAQYVENKKASRLGSFRVFLEPIYILIVATNAIYTSSFVCMVTIIVDFSRDIHIETSNEKYILMLLSVGDLIGRLCLGWITDRGYISRPTFAATCFACQGLFTAAIAFSSDFTSLAVLVTLYGLSQAGLIVIFPVIISQYIDQDKQSIAIPSYHFLTGPACMSLAPLIGYFRDEVGAYDWIFYGIGILSSASSVLWIIASCILKYRKQS